MQDFDLMGAVKENYKRNGGGLSYAVYFDGRQLLYKEKPIYLMDKKSRVGSEPEFFTLATVPGNKSLFSKEFIDKDDEVLRRIFDPLRNNC